MSEPKTSVPKFGSFKPNSAPHALPHQVEKVEKNEVQSHRRDRDDDAQNRHGHRMSRRYHSKERRREASKERLPSCNHNELVGISQPSPSPRVEFEGIFVIDRKGDLRNLMYGSNHRYDVPPFYRSGAGSILGMPSYLRIDRDHGDDKGIVLIDRRIFTSRHRDDNVFSRIEKQRPRLLRLRPGTEVQDSLEHDYVPLQAPRGKKGKRMSEDSSGSEGGEVDYRSIHGKAKSRDEPEDEGFQYATGSDDSAFENGRIVDRSAEDADVRQKTVDLSRKVEQYPHDISAWLALIDHQDSIFGGIQRRVTKAESSSRADVKIHMYEQALKRAQSLKDRETLLLGLMVEGGKIWELKAQSEKWEQISKENIDSLLLWKSYLDFKQTTFGTFQYEETRDICRQRMKLFLPAADENQIHAPYDQIIYILLRLTTFIRESGYTELAVAAWQAILEFGLFAPLEPLNYVGKKSLFKEFWDSETPRIGEDTAMGWRHFSENESVSDAPDPTKDEEGKTLDHLSIFKSWAEAEQISARVSRVPARTMDDVVEDDPFRVILASDIEEFLVSFPTESEELKCSLVKAFLLFCRLPSLNSKTKASATWSSDPFFGERFLECDSIWVQDQYTRKDTDPARELRADISSILELPFSNFQSSPDSFFSNSWFKSFQSWREIYGGDNGPLKFQFIRNTLKQLLQVFFREDLAEYYLALEFQNEPEYIKKVCKNLLKQHPSSLRLYNAYAMIEWSRGKRDLANGVYTAAIDMAKSMPESNREDVIILWRSWTWAYLEVRDKAAATSRLLSIESGTASDSLQPSPILLLKTKKFLTQRRDYHLYLGLVPTAILYAECLVVLEYLTAIPSRNETQSSTQGNITTALEEHTNFSRTLRQMFRDRGISDTSSYELFLQSAARLLYHHASIGPFRPALLREHLTNYIKLFPQNTIFISLYAFNESRLRVDNRVRNILSSTILIPANSTLTSRLFAIYFEITHGTIHSVRSAFEHALDTPCKHSPGLWRFYLLYTLRIPQFRKHSKDVWYRALRACPWAKQLYITGFEGVDIVDRAEGMGTWRVMVEKGLRVHVDLEEIFEMEGGLLIR